MRLMHQRYLCKDSRSSGVTRTSRDPFNFTVAVVLLVFSYIGPSTVSVQIKSRNMSGLDQNVNNITDHKLP